jgi:predicted site-specific integrase-resolvase
MARTPALPKNPATLTEAAAKYGRHRVTFRRWAAEGKIHAWRQGPKLIIVDLDEIAKLTKPVTIGR